MRLFIIILAWILAVIFICRFMGMTHDIEKKDVNNTKPKDN